ncbi:MAG: Eco57I restriction-modification methylase domain-containing protein [Promethearchaeota archaeon]
MPPSREVARRVREGLEFAWQRLAKLALEKRGSPGDGAGLDRVKASGIALVFRLLVVHVAVSRGVLSARDLAGDGSGLVVVRGAGLGQGTTWAGLRRLFRTINGERVAGMGNPPAAGALPDSLFSDEKFPLLGGLDLDDEETGILLALLFRGVRDLDALRVEDLGALYEALSPLDLELAESGRVIVVTRGEKRGRKGTGWYYTPKPVVSHIVKVSLRRVLGKIREECSAGGVLDEAAYSRKVAGIRVLDPAMGTGNFLLEAGRQLAREVLCLPVQPGDGEAFGKVLARVFNENMYGVDVDPVAVSIASALSWLLTLSEGGQGAALKPRFRVGDSLFGHVNLELGLRCTPRAGRGDLADLSLARRLGFGEAPGEPGIGADDTRLDPSAFFSSLGISRPLHWALEFPEVFKGGRPGFDVVVGNPPYISHGLGRVGKIPPAVDAYLREAYPNSAQYKISWYALFVERGLSLARDGAIFGFLLPDSYLVGRYFSKLRAHLLGWRMFHLVKFSKDFWKGADVGFPTILFVEKERPPPDFKVEFREVGSLEGLNHAELSPPHAVSQASFSRNRRSRFRFIPDDRAREVVRKIEGPASRPLGDFLEFHHGIRSRVGRAAVVAPERRGPSWKSALVSGSEVRQFLVRRASHFVNVDPDLLFSGGWDPGRVERPKILIRRTGDRLVAALDTRSYYHTNALIFANLRPGFVGPEREVDFLSVLVAILNSGVFQYYYERVSMKRRRTMPQVEIDMLEELRVPRIRASDLDCERVSLRDAVSSGGLDSSKYFTNLTAELDFGGAVCVARDLSRHISSLRGVEGNSGGNRRGNRGKNRRGNRRGGAPPSSEATRLKTLLDRVVGRCLFGLEPEEVELALSSVRPPLY